MSGNHAGPNASSLASNDEKLNGLRMLASTAPKHDGLPKKAVDI